MKFSRLYKDDKEPEKNNSVNPQANPQPVIEPKPAVEETVSAAVLSQERPASSDVHEYAAAQAEALEVYHGLLDCTEHLIEAAKLEKPFDSAELTSIAGRVIASLKREDGHILVLTQDYPVEEKYLQFHMANVAIISCYLGMRMKLADSTLAFLCAAALLHDVGMTKFDTLVNTGKRLSPDEMDSVKTHVQLGIEIVKKIITDNTKLAENIITYALMVHEKVDGTGYPYGLNDSQIHVIGQIIGLADTYEAMTHKRPWRDAMSPLEVVRHIIHNSAVTFRPALVKLFIETFSIFPPGSYVELSTGEAAQVITVNEGYVTRPWVGVLRGKQQMQMLNLLEHPLVHIVKQMPKPEPKLKPVI